MGLTQVGTDGIKDDAVTIAKQAAGTDGQIITFDASGNPKAIGPGTDGQVLTSAGAGAEPVFEDAVSEGTQVKSTTNSNETAGKVLTADGDGTCSWQSGADATKMPLAGGTFTGSVIHNYTDAVQLPSGTTAQRPGSPSDGDTRVNTTLKRLEFYVNGAWQATNAAPTISSISGTIYTAIAQTLTLNVSETTATVDVLYYESSTLLATDSGRTVTSGSCTSTTVAAVYNQTAGDTITIKVKNSTGAESNGVDKTVTASPSGGTITHTGGKTYHKFTSNGTFTNTVSGLSVDYVIVAGGGGGGGNK